MEQLGPNNVKMRNYIYSLIDFTEVKSILDIGCGDGYDLLQIAKLTQKNVRLVGIDKSTKKLMKHVK